MYYNKWAFPFFHSLKCSFSVLLILRQMNREDYTAIYSTPTALVWCIHWTITVSLPSTAHLLHWSGIFTRLSLFQLDHQVKSKGKVFCCMTSKTPIWLAWQVMSVRSDLEEIHDFQLHWPFSKQFNNLKQQLSRFICLFWVCDQNTCLITSHPQQVPLQIGTVIKAAIRSSVPKLAS